MVEIAVLAAGGHTGRRVVEELRARGASVRALTRRDADASDKGAVQRAIAGADAMVNLAGPFLATGLAPIEAAIDARVPYLDTTGEQAFMLLARERLHERAKAAGVPVVNACAFEYALGDLAAKRDFAQGGAALHVLYRPRSTAPSAGTKKSMLRVFAAPTLSYEQGKLTHISYGRYARTFATQDGPRAGAAFAGGEVLTVPRHTPFATVRTYFQTKPSSTRIAKALGPLARVALRGPVLRAADKLVDARHRAPANERARGEIHLVSEPDGKHVVAAASAASEDRDVPRHVVIRTPDPYVATAHIAAEAALRLAAPGGRRAGGVLAPAEVLDPAEFLGALAKAMPEFSVGPLSAAW